MAWLVIKNTPTANRLRGFHSACESQARFSMEAATIIPGTCKTRTTPPRKKRLRQLRTTMHNNAHTSYLRPLRSRLEHALRAHLVNRGPRRFRRSSCVSDSGIPRSPQPRKPDLAVNAFRRPSVSGVLLRKKISAARTLRGSSGANPKLAGFAGKLVVLGYGYRVWVWVYDVMRWGGAGWARRWDMPASRTAAYKSTPRRNCSRTRSFSTSQDWLLP